MKMKSKMFGLNAKLALAVLAVGAMFASCYDSENGDVTKPYVAPDPVYTISGTITDALTGETIESPTIEISDVKDGTLTYKMGSYSAQVKSSGDKTVKVSASGYDAVSRTVTVAPLKNGEASTTVVNIALTKTGSINIDNVKVSVVSSTVESKDKKISSSDEVGLDLTADDEAAIFVRNFDVVVGAIAKPEIEVAFEDAPAGLVEYAKSYLGTVIGQFGNLQQISVPYTISIAPWQCVTSVTVTYAVVTTQYAFEYEGNVYNMSIEGVRTYTFSTQFTPNHNFSHSHGHGHGHGDGNVNAGGGILTPEM